MNRSLIIICVMGLVALVMLSICGSFFVGKVGGAEHISVLRDQLKGVFGSHMKDPKALTVKLKKVEDDIGLVVEYSPNERLVKDDRALHFHMSRVSGFILGSPRLLKHAQFVILRLHVKPGKTVEKMYDRKTPVSAF